MYTFVFYTVMLRLAIVIELIMLIVSRDMLIAQIILDDSKLITGLYESL
jgi:hypothetical protein